MHVVTSLLLFSWTSLSIWDPDHTLNILFEEGRTYASQLSYNTESRRDKLRVFISWSETPLLDTLLVFLLLNRGSRDDNNATEATATHWIRRTS